MLWIKEVEMVESVDDLKTSQSIGGHRFPNVEMLDAKIASALKKIITNPCFKKESQLGGALGAVATPISLRKTDCLMIYECFRVTVLDDTDLFSISLHGDDVQDFDTRLDLAPLSTKELPKASILESLCKMRIRESVQLQTVSRPNCPKLKIRTRNFKVRNERVETEVLIKTQTGKMSALNWKAKGQCSKGDARSFRHDDCKRGKNTQSCVSCSKTADTK